jgi:uridine phosphorylase
MDEGKGVKTMLKKNEIPILEYDDTFEALIHAPKLISKIDIGDRAVLVFFQEVLDVFQQKYQMTKVYDLRSEMGQHPVYQMIYEGKKIILMHPGLGGPLAVGFLEELIALGCTKFIACGGAGVLDKTIRPGFLIVPTQALRADGASYHYLPATRYVNLNPIAIAAITNTLTQEKIPYLSGLTWTTDAFYRETPEMIRYRKAEGCIAVEMECASFAACAEFRHAIFGQILYGGDDVSNDVWDSRAWSKLEIRERLVELAIKACLKL